MSNTNTNVIVILIVIVNVIQLSLTFYATHNTVYNTQTMVIVPVLLRVLILLVPF